MDPILLAGGSGLIGRWTARHLRDAHPELPLLIGGRDLAKARGIAEEVGGAEAVGLDLSAADLGLGERAVAAVGTLFRDDALTVLRFAQARGAGHIGISALGVHEIGPEVALFAARPHAAPIVLGAEWLVGATTIPALRLAERSARIDEIRLAAVLDEKDEGGPTQVADLERASSAATPALVRRDGAYSWLAEEAMESTVRAVDGTSMPASPLSPFDVVVLAAAIGAPTIRFDLATGVTSSRRAGGELSTEILVELVGEDPQGRPLRVRQALVHPQGQMSPTGLGVAMVLERLAGLAGGDPVHSGLHFPSQLLDPETYLDRLRRSGAASRSSRGRRPHDGARTWSRCRAPGTRRRRSWSAVAISAALRTPPPRRVAASCAWTRTDPGWAFPQASRWRRSSCWCPIAVPTARSSRPSWASPTSASATAWWRSGPPPRWSSPGTGPPGLVPASSGRGGDGRCVVRAHGRPARRAGSGRSARPGGHGAPGRSDYA